MFDVVNSDCPQHCSLCWNETECYDCAHGYFLDQEGLCHCKYTTLRYVTFYTMHKTKCNNVNVSVIC